MRGEAADGGAHRRAVRDGGEHDLGAAEFRQFGGGVGGLAVDVVGRAELPGERLLVLPAGDGDRAEAHLGGVLNAEVAEPADAEDRDEVARLRRRCCAAR